MLDHFSIVTQGGIVLCSKSFTPSPSPVDSLIRSAIIEERSNSTSTNSNNSISKWEKDSYSILWTLANEFDIIFILAFQRILRLSYVEELLLEVKRVFLNEFGDNVMLLVQRCQGKPLESFTVEQREILESRIMNLFSGWAETFAKLLKHFEEIDMKTKRVKTKVIAESILPSVDPSQIAIAQTPTKNGDVIDDAALIAKNIAAMKARKKNPVKSGKGKVVEESKVNDSPVQKSTPSSKVARKWDDSKVTAHDLASFDYSSDKPDEGSGTSTPTTADLVATAAMGTRGTNGLYEVADYKVGKEDEIEAPPPKNAFYSMLSKLSLNSKILSSEDLAPTLLAMKEHLMSKNVAQDIAAKVTEAVGNTLQGKVVGGFSSIRLEVKKALETSLIKILTPKTSTDLLLDISRKRTSSLELLSSSSKKSNVTPYSITFVGVNGVGKSTNLSKVAFWLLQNKMRVVIAACDTFRSGAVEQLRTHVRNLGKLGEEIGGIGLESNGIKMIELFEKGYGKDAAGIAKEAIQYGKENQFDVVLIDTAGRMQDNEPLMRALAKLVTVNNPDKIVFVGEALVGNEAVDQLTKFNRSLRDFSGTNDPRGIDGMILTKFDTIDDKVGAALSMTYVTGQPILFVGTGQTYSDLKALKVTHIVSALLS